MSLLRPVPSPIHALRQAAPTVDAAVPVRAPGDAPGHVVIDRVSKRFITRDGAIFDALSEVSIDIAPVTIYGIIGRSGAGKSTLIRTINQLEKPTSGRVLVGGRNVAELDRAAIAQVRRRIGMIFQHFNLLSAKTVAQNIALPLKIAKVPRLSPSALDARQRLRRLHPRRRPSLDQPGRKRRRRQPSGAPKRFPLRLNGVRSCPRPLPSRRLCRRSAILPIGLRTKSPASCGRRWSRCTPRRLLSGQRGAYRPSYRGCV